MRKVIRRRIRHEDGGVNIAADIDAVIAVNAGEDAETSRTVLHSSHTVVQGAGAAGRTPDASRPSANDLTEEKS